MGHHWLDHRGAFHQFYSRANDRKCGDDHLPVKNGSGHVGTDSRGIGGTEPGAENRIAGNSGPGIVLRDAIENTVQGNRIGGSAGLGNVGGVLVDSTSVRNLIGGEVNGAGNVIIGNQGPGISVNNSSGSGTAENIIQGNLIGLDEDGITELGNTGHGIEIRNSPGNQIGGASAESRNVVSANSSSGILIQGIPLFEGIVDRASFLNVTGAEQVAPLENHIGTLGSYTTTDGKLTLTGNLSLGRVTAGLVDLTSKLPGTDLGISGNENFNIDFAEPVFGFGMEMLEVQNDPYLNGTFVESTFSITLKSSGSTIDTFTFSLFFLITF